ncbi:MAG: DNA adenine methylase [Pseudoxanthomonas sp.]
MFKPLYYLGCKASFIEPILNALNDVDSSGGRACDLFSGSGAVASALSGSRDVTAVDIQEYSRVICSAQLSPTRLSKQHVIASTARLTESELAGRLLWALHPLIEHEKAAIDEALDDSPEAIVELLESYPLTVKNLEKGTSALSAARAMAMGRLKKEQLLGVKETTVTTYFGGIYFSFAQAAVLDVALTQAAEAPDNIKDTLLSASLSAASVLVNTVGKQFAQPLRPRNKSGLIKAGIGTVIHKDRSMDPVRVYSEWLSAYANLPVSKGSHEAFKMDYLDAIKTQGGRFSVVYADPPYTRDHYSRFYHVLETMCLRDTPAISTVTKNGKLSLSRGIYREDRHQSPFCIRSEAPKALAELFEATSQWKLPVVLSYSPHESGDGTHPRVMSGGDIVTIAKRFYRNVVVELLDGSTHNKLNKAALELNQRKHAEMIVKCFA